MKWLMVEDEMIEREGLKKMITDQFPDLNLIGEAASGKEAIHLAKERNPDLITMDIKMPGMDGIQAVKEIKAWNPDVEIIMMTAYDEFEYAREVMRQGVQEYVLKPAKKSELYATFQRVLDGLEEKRQKENQGQDKQAILSLIQSNWMQAYFTERVMEQYPEELASFFPASSGKGCAMIVHLDAPQGYEEQQVWIKEELEKSTDCLVGPIQSGHFPVWIFAFKNEEKVANLSKWIRTILQRFQSSFQKKITIGVGNLYDDPSQLIHSYHEAVIAMAFVNLQKGYVLYEEAKSQLATGAFNRVVQEKKIYEAVRSGDTDLAIHQFEQLWPLLDEDDEGKISYCKDLVHAVYGIIKEMGMAEQSLLRDFPEETDPSDWRKWAVQKVAQASDWIRSWKHVTSKDAIWEAEEWIKAHFEEPITLEDVAEHVSLSPYYFSKIFKERLNKSFVDYVTDLRVGKAKELLSTTDKPLKEISQLVGYKDPNYFSRVFKKRMGVTPSEYRVPHTTTR